MKTRTLFLTFAFLIALGGSAMAAIQTEVVEYEAGGQRMVGYLAYDDSWDRPRAGVMVICEFWGLNEYCKARARQIAELGYVAFCPDMYGDGKTATVRDEAREWATEVRSDPALRTERLRAAYNTFSAMDKVDPSRIGSMGYCFGGGMSLQMAYLGLPLAGIVSFHGSLPLPTDEEKPNIATPMLICHGADDPIESMPAFKQIMADLGADMVFVEYASARHGFTNPDNPPADPATTGGVAYDEHADKRSWQHMVDFWAEVLNP